MFSLKRTSTQNAWWVVEPPIPQIQINWNHHPLENKFKAASQLHRLHPHLMLVSYINKRTCCFGGKRPESNKVLKPSNPGLKVEDRIRRQLSLECFEFPECRFWWCAKLPKLWRDVRTTEHYLQNPYAVPTQNWLHFTFDLTTFRLTHAPLIPGNVHGLHDNIIASSTS